MSVSAFDQLLLSAAGKPSLSSASKKRDFLLNTSANAPSRLDQALAVHQRLLTQAKQRKRTPSPRSHGMKKGAWSRSILSAFKGDQLAQLEGTGANTIELTGSGGFSIDSKVKLFFDGLAPDANSENNETSADQGKRRSLLAWPRLPSPVKLLRRRQSARDVLLVPVPLVNDHVLRQELMSRQIERVRWRRRGSSQFRRLSLSGGTHAHRRLKVSANSSSTNSDEGNYDASEAVTTETNDDTPGDASEAAESNARLSFELMERKYNTTPQWRDPDYYSELITTRSESADEDQQQHESVSVGEPVEAQQHAVSELEALRAENAEQKALIRQLLIENRRLLAQQQTQTTVAVASPKPRLKKAKHKRERPEDGDEYEFDRRDRGISVASTWSSTTTASASWAGDYLDRRQSLSFDVIDGHETMVDHKFELLVAEITAELAELLSEDSSSSLTSSTSSSTSLRSG